MTALDTTTKRHPAVRSDRNAISAPCWDGRHRRCTGWLVVPDEGGAARGLPVANRVDRSIRCECETCDHSPVSPDRHLHENPQGLS